MLPLVIRPATDDDFDTFLPIFRAAVAPADALAYDPDISPEEAKALWFAPGYRHFVAIDGDRVVGCYRLRANYAHRGSHVANAGYIVDPAARGRGVASAMCEHSLRTARELGFTAMQFNYVVSTNERAVRLWQRMGFEIVGRIPKAFRHGNGELVDTLIMHRFLP